MGCQHPFPQCESQSTSPPWAGLWTYCGGSSDSNLVSHLPVLVFFVSQELYIFHK